MAREGITQAQVFNAADQISSDGQQPTVAAIRTKLGTGSYTTITAMLRAWKQASTPADETLDVPQEVTEALQRAGQIVWKAAQDHFRHELATLKTDTAKAIAHANATAEEAFAEIARLEAAQEVMTDRADQAEAALADAREALRVKEVQLAAAHATIAATEARLKEQSAILSRFAASAPVKVEPKTQVRRPNRTKAPPQPKPQQLDQDPATA